MLREIRVKNVALLQDVRVEFEEGFNVITGETGAGKSILIESLKLALGERVPPSLVPKEGAATVEMVYEMGEDVDEFRVLLENAGVEYGDDLILRRVVNPTGRSRCFVNDSAVTGKLLSELTSSLVNVLGQHALQKLFGARTAAAILDEYAGCGSLLSEYGRNFREWRRVRREIEALRRELPHLEERVAWFDEAIAELEKAGVYPGEEEEIEKELPVLKNAAKIRDALQKAYGLISQNDVNCLSLLKEASDVLEGVAEFDVKLKEFLELLNGHLYGLSDLSHDLISRASSVPLDDERFDRLTERLSLIRKLSRKYSVFPDELEGKLVELKREREKLKGISGELEVLLEKERELKEKVRALGKELSRKRSDAIRNLEKDVMKELEDLELAGARFKVNLVKNENGEPAAWGLERAEFLFSSTEDVEPGPLVSIASGGELSRVMLAIHNAVAGKGKFRTLIFDEVDSGIGGKVAEKVGEKLKSLSSSAQVICITHLPQIAALANHHVKVFKEEAEGRVKTRVKILGPRDRVDEIARMVSGVKISAEAVKYAENLLKRGAG